jgi:predicted kinase
MLILIRGLPGSGKSTLAYQLKAMYDYAFIHEDYETRRANVYEADMYFMKAGSYEFDRNKLHAAHRWCQEATDEHLSEGNIAIVSNTFTTHKELRPYFEIAKKYDMIPVVYTCLNDWGSVHNVPQDTLISMKNRFQHDISALMKEFS